MARRDLSGAVDLAVLERMTGGDAAISEEVLGLFVEQAGLWSAMLDPKAEGWRDGVHTIRGAAAGVGAGDLAEVCAAASSLATSCRSLAAPMQAPSEVSRAGMATTSTRRRRVSSSRASARARPMWPWLARAAYDASAGSTPSSRRRSTTRPGTRNCPR